MALSMEASTPCSCNNSKLRAASPHDDATARDMTVEAVCLAAYLAACCVETLSCRLLHAPPRTFNTTSNMPSRVKTRFLVLSDTHNAGPAQNAASTSSPFRPPLPKADVLLHCGDLTMVGLMNEYEKTLQMLVDIDAELKLVIAGNHDISLDDEYYARKGQYMQRLKEPDEDLPRRARELWTGEAAKQAGIFYLDEGTYSFTLRNGARLRVSRRDALPSH